MDRILGGHETRPYGLRNQGRLSPIKREGDFAIV